MNNFNLSTRNFTRLFWSVILENSFRWNYERESFFKNLEALESLRSGAKYNTGTISMSNAWCLYSAIRYFEINSIIEIGTFIGKSTLSMAAAVDSHSDEGIIHTCDFSNDIKLPWSGKTKIIQYPNTSSHSMLSMINSDCEFYHLDGRISSSDMELFEKMNCHNAIFALDDFEGVEKGVANLSQLRSNKVFAKHILIYPCPSDILERNGLLDSSLMAMLIPVSLINFTNQ